MSNEPKPIDELAFILEKFGWDTKFSDLSLDQVHVLIFALQEAKKLTEEIDIESSRQILSVNRLLAFYQYPF